MKLKRLELQNFKGAKSASYEFTDRTEICGANGCGKSTIANAWLWLFMDSNYELGKNPDVRPLEEVDGDVRVTAIIDVNGVEVSVAKIQKKSVKEKADGTKETSLTNTYEVNGISLGKTKFIEKMQEYGIDLANFVYLSHTDGFVGLKQAEARKKLFEMVSDISDVDVAGQTDGVDEVKELLEKYSMEEISALQKQELRKINEVYGKTGEILRAEISGLEQSKVDIDVAELELQRNGLNEEIQKLEKQKNDTSAQYEEISKTRQEILEMRFKLNGMVTDEEDRFKREVAMLEAEKKIAKDDLESKQRVLDVCDKAVADISTRISKAKIELKDCQKNYLDAKEKTISDDATICPYCQQELPEDKKQAVIDDFEKTKANQLQAITDLGSRTEKSLAELKDKLEKAYSEREDANKRVEEAKTHLKEVNAKSVSQIDVKSTDEYIALAKEIEEKEKSIENVNVDAIQGKINQQISELRSQLLSVEKQIALVENNNTIDEKILSLRQKQGEYEQNRANAEKILKQLDKVSKKKNELLTDEINSHFGMVKFELFTYLKNGNYSEICEPTYDGKKLSSHMNTGLQVLCKLDICLSLQKFYGCELPIFLDNAECLDASNRAKVKSDSQLIFLRVVDDYSKKYEDYEDKSSADKWVDENRDWLEKIPNEVNYYELYHLLNSTRL